MMLSVSIVVSLCLLVLESGVIKLDDKQVSLNAFHGIFSILHNTFIWVFY